MKARDQTYSQEAASLLRDVSMYRALTRDQVLRLYPGKREKINELLIYLTKQERLLYEDGLYRAAPGHDGKVDRALFAAVWVLVDFIDRVEYHAVADYPAKIIFFADGAVYEIIHVEQGKEAMMTNILTAAGDDPSRRLIMVDTPEQINTLDIPNACGYCTVSPDGEVQYYQKE